MTCPAKGALVVFDKASDSQDQTVVLELGKKLSRFVEAPVLAVLNHDDDILWYNLFEKGECTDEYNSSPGYFDSNSEPQLPSGANAKKLCKAFGAQAVRETEQILRKSSYEDDGYIFAEERHEDLVKILNLPDSAVGFSYADISQGELPFGLTQSDITRV